MIGTGAEPRRLVMETEIEHSYSMLELSSHRIGARIIQSHTLWAQSQIKIIRLRQIRVSNEEYNINILVDSKLYPMKRRVDDRCYQRTEDSKSHRTVDSKARDRQMAPESSWRTQIEILGFMVERERERGK